MREVIARGLLIGAVAAAIAPVAAAQTPAPCPCPPSAPAGPWTGSVGFGLALNRGNTDTMNVNLTADTTYDPKTKNVWKLQALYLRGSTGGATTVDRFLFQTRYERTLTTRTYAFAQLQFLEDKFKAIDYMWAPGGGIGYKLIDTPVTKLSADAGVGAKRQKDTGQFAVTSFIITASDKLEHKLTDTATITQGFSALWNPEHLDEDSIYTFSAGLAAAMTTRTQLKVELQDTYAKRPASMALKANDVALLTAVVYKF
jgi:putative salt-induced outer membrane protein YdiY